QALERLALRQLGLVRQQDEQIDVRRGVELAASIAAGGDERGAFRQAGHVLDRTVGERGVRLQQPPRIRLGEVSRAQRGALGGDALAQARRGHLEAASEPIAGAGCTPAESVRTSKPPSVTATVCSHWADRLWSLVTMVQPSASSRIPGLPALIIGSTVKVMPGCRLSPVPGLP